MAVFFANDFFVIMIYLLVKCFIVFLRDTITYFKKVSALMSAVFLGGYFMLLNQYEVIPKTTMIFPIYQ